MGRRLVDVDTEESPALEGPAHQVQVEHRGKFLVPQCSCGWVGTARMRASSARQEARDHATLYVSSDLGGLDLPKGWEFIDQDDAELDPAESDQDG